MEHLYKIFLIFLFFIDWSDKTLDPYTDNFYPYLVANNIIDSGTTFIDGAYWGVKDGGFAPNTDVGLYIPMSDKINIKDIQSAIIYNRGTNIQFIGCSIELYNRSNDPNLESPLSSTNLITIADDVYCFDYPAIDTYTGGFSNTDSISQIASDVLALKEVVSEFAENANITGGLKVDTITTTGNVDISCSLNVETSLTTNQLIVNDDLYFDTIVIRRPNEVITNDTSVTNAGSINIRELQCWVNDVNILASNAGSLNSYYAYWSDKENDIGQHLTFVSEFAYNDIIGSDITGSPENSTTDFALTIKMSQKVPLTQFNRLYIIKEFIILGDKEQ